MGMMARMRGLASWFIILVGGLFVLFMVLSDSRIAEYFGQQSNNVGYIDGYEVTYQEFAALLERARTAQQQQTGQDIDESQMEYFRNQVWDALVTEKIVEKKMKEFGINVTDEEIRDALLGPEPPEFLKQNFIDSTGTFNREMYETALFDPRNREILLQVEDAVSQQKMQEKLQNMLFAAISVSNNEIEQKFIDQTFKMDAQYAVININSVEDSTIQVTDADIEEYYNSNLEDYKREPQRKLKYVLFQKKPSQGDSVGIKNNLNAIVDRLKQDTASFKTYVEIYSDQPYSLDTAGLSVIPQNARIPLTNGKRGEIIGPVLTYQGYIVYRLVDRFRSNETFVRASHILIKSGNDDVAALQKAQSIYMQLINGADFAELAAENSEDAANAANGGDLGWFGRGQMVGEFEDACFNGRIGVVQRPLKTSFGYHIIKVTDKTNLKYVYEKIINKIDASATTIDKLYNDGSDFSYLADKNGFESEADLLNYEILETNFFKADNNVIPGLGSNKALIE
ncbi:peptidylprolyl isomerase, partial [Bacteroidota bacterium]